VLMVNLLAEQPRGSRPAISSRSVKVHEPQGRAGWRAAEVEELRHQGPAARSEAPWGMSSDQFGR